MLKNKGFSDSDLQSFSKYQSHKSLADYCKISDDQQVLNTAKLIPFKNNIDEYNYDEHNYNEFNIWADFVHHNSRQFLLVNTFLCNFKLISIHGIL